MGIEARWFNIWTDAAAREFIREANDGDETVPTVRIGRRVMTNPSEAELAAALPGHVPPAAGRPVPPIVGLLSWAPTVGFVVASEVVSAAGHAPVGYGLDALALLAWWFTRPLRRRRLPVNRR